MEEQKDKPFRTEPALEELIRDPIMARLWQSDGINRDDIDAILDQLPERKAA